LISQPVHPKVIIHSNNDFDVVIKVRRGWTGFDATWRHSRFSREFPTAGGIAYRTVMVSVSFFVVLCSFLYLFLRQFVVFISIYRNQQWKEECAVVGVCASLFCSDTIFSFIYHMPSFRCCRVADCPDAAVSFQQTLTMMTIRPVLMRQDGIM
jgi:hypothetical protein